MTSRTISASGALQFLYGVGCYHVGVAGLVSMILATLGVLPYTGGPVRIEGTWAPIAFNLALISVFGIQHAIMARPAFKKRWTRVIPEAVERSTFTAISGALMGALIWLWQPLGDVVWTVGDGPARWAVTGLCALGWAYMFTASFAIDHFELFGLRQVWGALRGLDTAPPKFRARLMYRFDRHPIMTGVFVALWAQPSMTLGSLVLALGFSSYIIVGVTIEERDLRRHHGDDYAGYARRVRTIVPRLPIGA